MNENTINTRYQPVYHAHVGSGWANDPNGLVYYDGRLHLFYQHNPYASEWGPMHWGHVSSEDLVHWERHPIALVPEEVYENTGGCFSGTAIVTEEGKRLNLVYTGVGNGGQADGESFQQQCLATSEDGLHFEKYEKNPVIPTELLPDAVTNRADFRDPKVFREGDRYYCIAGVEKNLVLFTSADLKKWERIGLLFSTDQFVENGGPEGVLECPDYQKIDGRDILIMSPIGLTEDRKGLLQSLRFQSDRGEGEPAKPVQAAVWMTGKLDLAAGHFTLPEETPDVLSAMQELDAGFDFYAPETTKLPDGRTILIGWKEMWGRTYPTQEDGWCGSFTLPRELEIRQPAAADPSPAGRTDWLYQKPAREIYTWLSDAAEVRDVVLPDGQTQTLSGFRGDTLALDLLLDPGTAKEITIGVFASEDGARRTEIRYTPGTGTVTFDRTYSGRTILSNRGGECPSVVRETTVPGGMLHLEIFLDISCVEVFLADGLRVMTGNVYPEAGDTGIFFRAEGGEVRLAQAILRTHAIGD